MPDDEIVLSKRRQLRLSPAMIIIFGYLGMILVGTLLLLLPFATRSGESAGFLTALFTSTSASCVTGLVLFDTYTFWSGFGQAVILFLIQVGGLGIITMTMLVGIVVGRRIGLKQRVLMRNSISAPYMGGIVRLTKFALITTGVFELAGAVSLATVLVPKYGARGIWMSVFHSISAFCNAGFDIMGAEGEFSSMISFAENPVINITLIILIIVGGLGFFVWEDIKIHGVRCKRYTLHTKAVLVVSAALIIFPAIYFYIVNPEAFLGGGAGMKALFQSVTTRTAGFNTVDFSTMTEGSQLVTIVMMMIGGSPGSTAGGVKTTTLVVLLSCVAAVFRRRNSVHLFGRSVHSEVVRKAVAILTLYLVLFLTSSVLIAELEGVTAIAAMFESASAIGTVGLSLGLTPFLCTASKFIIIFLMYFGRVGCLTLLLVFTDNQATVPLRLPHEDITVG